MQSVCLGVTPPSATDRTTFAQSLQSSNLSKKAPNEKNRFGYRGWPQVGGYFDGDGTVYVRVHPWALAFSLHWVENWKPQLVQLQEFLQSKGVQSLMFPRVGAWLLVVERREDVLKTARRIIPFCSKKRTELTTAVGYLQNRLTASQAIEVFNNEVKSGQRIGIVREANFPFTRAEGLALRNSHTASMLSSLTKDQVEEIKALRLQSKLSVEEIGRRYGVTASTIWRALRRR